MELEEVIEDVKEAKLILLCNNVIELIVVITEGRKQGLFKNKFWNLENDEELDLSKLKNIAVEPVLKELDKQEKMIELMALAISSYDGQLVINQYKDRNEVKAKFEEYVEDGTYEQYFEKKADEVE